MPYVRSRAFSLGDDDPTTLATLPEDQWRGRMLYNQEAYLTAYRAWQKDDQKVRLLQIAATLSIPLAAAVWRHILKRGG